MQCLTCSEPATNSKLGLYLHRLITNRMAQVTFRAADMCSKGVAEKPVFVTELTAPLTACQITRVSCEELRQPRSLGARNYDNSVDDHGFREKHEPCHLPLLWDFQRGARPAGREGQTQLAPRPAEHLDFN